MSTPGELLEALGREARARLGVGAGAASGSDARMRTYRGRSVEELIPRIERDLGADAVIVRRREGLTGGVLGFFQHAFVEIEAMPGAPRVDVYDDAHAATPPPLPTAQASLPGGVVPMPSPGGPPPATSQYAAGPEAGAGGGYVSGHLAALARTGGIAPAPAPASGPPSWAPPPRPAAIDFRELLPREREFTVTRAREAPEASDSREAPEGAVGVGGERRTVAPGSHGRARAGVERGLRRLGIGEELAGELIDGALAHTLPLAPRAGLAQAVRANLAQRIPVAPPLPRTGGAIVIVGGGGAGKTTCCATLLDAYRRASSVPARYASIVRGPDGKELQLILSPQVVKPAAVGSARALRAIRAARTEGLAIIDTPRLSPSDRGEIRDLAKLLGQLAPERIVVALPATLGAAAAAQLLEALAPLRANAMVITHTDETDQLGVSIEAACAFGLAPEYTLERGRPGWRLRRVEPSELASRLLP